MRTPGSRETVFQRQLGIGVLDHVYNAEIARGKGISEAEEGDGDKYELTLHHRAGQRNRPPFAVEKVRLPVKLRHLAPFAFILIAAGCARSGEITTGGITAVRTACPVVGIPAGTGDITLFDPATSHDASALDVTAVMTNVRSTCTDATADVVTTVTFDV